MTKIKRFVKTHVKAVETDNGTLETKLAAIDGAMALKANAASPALAGVPTAPTPGAGTSNTQIATTAFVQSEINAKIAAADAMIYKGTLGSGGTVSTLPAVHSTGWTYKVITAGTYAAQKCEVGDMIICLTDGTAANDTHWTVVQNNIDGAVLGPTVAVADRIALFNGTSGTLIKDGGMTLSQLAQSSRSVIAGNGLTGGGTLGADITLNVGAGTGITVQADTVSHQVKPTTGTDAGGSGAVVTGVTVDAMGHVVSTTKGNITSVTGNAGTATKLQNARSLKVKGFGMIGGDAGFDGTANVELPVRNAACIDLSGGASDNIDLKSFFGDAYFRPLSNGTLVVNKVISGPGSGTWFTRLEEMKGNILLYMGNGQVVHVTLQKERYLGLRDIWMGRFFYSSELDADISGHLYPAEYTLQLHLTQQDAALEMILLKNRGKRSELPDLVAAGWSKSIPEVLGNGYMYHEQGDGGAGPYTDYTLQGGDWLYDEYITV